MGKVSDIFAKVSWPRSKTKGASYLGSGSGFNVIFERGSTNHERIAHLQLVV